MTCQRDAEIAWITDRTSYLIDDLDDARIRLLIGERASPCRPASFIGFQVDDYGLRHAALTQRAGLSTDVLDVKMPVDALRHPATYRLPRCVSVRQRVQDQLHSLSNVERRRGHDGGSHTRVQIDDTSSLAEAANRGRSLSAGRDARRGACSEQHCNKQNEPDVWQILSVASHSRSPVRLC